MIDHCTSMTNQYGGQKIMKTSGWKLLDFTLATKTTDSLLNSLTLILNIFRLTFLCQDWENSHECDFFFNKWPAAWSQNILVFDILNCGCFASLSWHAQTTEWPAAVIHFDTAFQTTTKAAVFFYFLSITRANNFSKWPTESKQNSIVQKRY